MGRSEELEFLQRAIADAAVAAVVVAGPAGVGKTRLAHEALAHARHQGLATAWAVATHSAAAIPFGAVAHLLPHPLPPSLGLANLLRALGEAVVGAHPGARLVLGVDDAHLLDHSSAALVHHLAATGGAFVLATVRSGEQTPDAVRALGKDLGQRLELQSLSRAEVEALVPAVLGGDVDRAALRELWQASRGNALFLRELIADGLAAGTVEWVGGLWRWRGQSGRLGALTELVESRLAGLAPAQRQALEVIAAAEPVGLALLEFLVPPPAVEALERAGLVQTTVDQRRVAISVAHPLYAEVVRAATPRSRTQNIAAGLARALEATGTRRRQDVLRLATWSVEASSYDRPQLLLAGAAQATSALDLALAERLARAAGDGGGLAGRLILAQALTALGHLEDAEDVYRSSEELVTNDAERTRVAIARAMNLFFWLQRADDAGEVVARALAPIQDPALAEELVAWRSGLLLYSGHFLEGLRTAMEILDGPRPSPRALMWAALVATWGLPMVGRFKESRAISARALRVMDDHAPVIFFAPQLIHMRRSLASLFEGDLGGALAAIEHDYQKAIDQRWDGFLAMCSWGAGWMLRFQGRVASALSRQLEAVALCRDVDWGAHLQDALAEAAHAAALLGDLHAADA
ncbi:MAG TPA: AAA family ATPase, partial [Acidimicrobiales bacterium]